MENLNKVLNILKSKKDSYKGDYYIPECWNSFEYNEFKRIDSREREINVNPYEFMISSIEKQIQKKTKFNDDLKPLGLSKDAKPIEPNTSVIYSMLPRMFSAWNHKGDEIQSGSFLKAICLLPYLKNLNVNIIYMLPIFKYSERNKKGQVGSPYSIKDMYKLDPNLHDDLLGGKAEESVELEFKAFVEACHALGIQVMIDFVFRTVSRDNDLMIEHPEWFYWINKKAEKKFKALSVDGLKSNTGISPQIIPNLYSSTGLKNYLKQFSNAPNVLDAKKWSKLVEKHKKSGENILELIEKEFQITTTPGFSDCINDPQPAWSDVTYYKLYFDVHRLARDYIDKNQPPYVMQDTAKTSLFECDEPNKELWNYIVDVIPYYQDNFGIDGARIDMAHALPVEITKSMIKKVKENNKHFILWSEEFNPKNSKGAKDAGYDFITGGFWSLYKEIEKPSFYKKITEDIMNSVLPLSAALEMADTPRAAFRFKNPKSLEMMLILNAFMPNAITYINSGLEVMEIQPMNLGLDNTEAGRFVLNRKDPMYGKLAFFDNYQIHWTSKEQPRMSNVFKNMFELKKQFAELITKENFVLLNEINNGKKTIFILFHDKKAKRSVFFLANRTTGSNARVILEKYIPKTMNTGKKISIVHSNIEQLIGDKIEAGKQLQLSPKDFLVGVID